MYDEPRQAPQGLHSPAAQALYAQTGPLPTTAGNRPEIAEALSSQEKMTHALLEVIDVLESRLMPALGSAGPTDTQLPSVPYASSLGNCIAENTGRLQVAINRLNTLRGRLLL